MSDIRRIILETFNEALEISNSKLNKKLNDETILLESGLDSLGFAVLVAKLEEKFGFDPFAIMEDPVYPTTFKEFVDIYLHHNDVKSK